MQDLGAGNTENAKEMACAFNKLFLLTVIVATNTDCVSGDRAALVLVQQVAGELRSSSSAIRAIDSIFLLISERSDLNSMATYSPNVSNSSGTLRIIKFSACFRHSSSDVLLDLRIFLVFGEDAGMGAAASAPSPEFSVTSSEASAGTA